MALKERILTGWTFQRFVFLALGVYLLISAAKEQLWMGVLMGAYFASMGLFAFGCAGGACGPASLRMGNKQEPTPVNPENMDIEFEEIKSR
jgi:hypothetical protein